MTLNERAKPYLAYVAAALAGLSGILGAVEASKLVTVSLSGTAAVLGLWRAILETGETRRREVDAAKESKKRQDEALERAWQHIDFLLRAAGAALNERARVSLHLVSRETPTALECNRRWVPSQGVLAARAPREPFKSGFACLLAFGMPQSRHAGTGLIPQAVLANINQMRLWHEQHGRVDPADSGSLGDYLLDVRAIDCFKLKRDDGATVGIITVDVTSDRVLTRCDRQLLTTIAITMERVLVMLPDTKAVQPVAA